jgi:hypothetical protein
VPRAQLPELLQDPAGVMVAFPCESTAQNAVSQLAPVLATHVPVAVEQVAHPEHALPLFCQAPLGLQICG